MEAAAEVTRISRMFPFINKTCNPLGGFCKHACEYCWARKLAERYMHRKYRGEPRIFQTAFKQISKFVKGDFVFVCDMCDLFGDWVPRNLIEQIIDAANHSPAQFLFLTKNPKRYADFVFNSNCVLGATIETDLDMLHVNDAPPRTLRLTAMTALLHPRKMVSVEPIMRHSPLFGLRLLACDPEFVAVGYDNYNNHLTEPSLSETLSLISFLQTHNVKVYKKTLREPHLP